MNFIKLEDAYKIFHIQDMNNISLDELKKKYHKLCLIYHPDKPSGSTKQFLHVKECYEILIRHIHYNHKIPKPTEFNIYEYFLSFLNVNTLEKILHWLSKYKDYDSSKQIINLKVKVLVLTKDLLFLVQVN